MERERRKLGDWRMGALVLTLGHIVSKSANYLMTHPYFCGLPLASKLVLMSSQSFKLV